MSRYRRPVAAIMLSIGLAGFSAAVSGCTLTSPKVISTPYEAADGTNAELGVSGGSVLFRNFLLVSAAQGKPGVLVGAVSTDTKDPVQLRVSVINPSGDEVLGSVDLTATAGELTQIGSGNGPSVQIPEVPLPPGSVLTVQVQSGAGTQSFALPVLAQEHQYATITATESATPTPKVTPSASASASPSISASASPSVG